MPSQPVGRKLSLLSCCSIAGPSRIYEGTQREELGVSVMAVVSKRDSVRGSCLRSLSHLRGDLQIQLLQTLRRELHHATVAGCEELPDLIVLAWRHGN